jgi:16S rRNA processing protein RimM
MEQKILVAVIVKPQGIRGEVKVKTFTDAPEDLQTLAKVFIDDKPYKIVAVRGVVGDTAFIALKGVADRNAAEALRGRELYALREDIPPLPDGRYFIADLIGCRVADEEGKEIGVLSDVTPAKTDVYSVTIGGKEVMFAAVDGVILNVDVEQKVITVQRKRFEEVAVLD